MAHGRKRVPKGEGTTVRKRKAKRYTEINCRIARWEKEQHKKGKDND